MANVYLYDAKSLRRFDFEQSKAANRRSHAKETHKTKKKHIAQLHDKNEEKKKRVVKVNKGRDKSPQVVLLRSIMQAIKVNAKFEFEHKKFKGEFGIFVKDDRNQGKPRMGQAHRHVLFRFPNELRYKNKRSTMHVYPKGCWSDSREKTVSLLIMVEVVEDWEQNAEDGLVTERNADALYPPSEDSDDGYDDDEDDEAREERRELRRMRQKREEEKEERKLKRMVRDEKWFLVEKKLNEENKKGSPRTKCECCNYDVSPLRDEKEIETLMKRIEKEFRKLEEGKTLDPIPDRINRLIVQKQKEEEEEAAREASALAGDAVPPKQCNSNSDTDESDD